MVSPELPQRSSEFYGLPQAKIVLTPFFPLVFLILAVELTSSSDP